MKIFAHRGLSGFYPENTMLSFKKCINLDLYGIELDVQKTKDNHLVVIHDEKVDRTFNSTGYVKNMTLKEFAERLNGTEYNGYPIFSKEDIGIAKENGFVIVTGASDDLMEFDGAIYSEGDCFDGGKVYFSKNGVEEDKTQNVINALWCEAEDENGVVIPWAYETKIPHETFYVMDAGEVYCRGIVFDVNDVK